MKHAQVYAVLSLGLVCGSGCGAENDEEKDAGGSGGETAGDSGGGSPASTGGSTPSGGESGQNESGGSSAEGGSGGSASGGATASTGGVASEGPCSSVPFPEADPSMAGPFAVVTETEVGPLAGEGEDGEPVPFTLFRPETLGEEGRCHPIITWGNGTGSTPNLYGVMLRHLASHGFLVIGSDSPNVARGEPPPMVVGVKWLIEENANPSSAFYQKVDTTNVGATGHSQGGMATSMAGNDPVVTTIAPLCGAGRPSGLSGPAFFMCGGMDDVVTCEGIENTFNSVDDVPAMFANFLMGDHADWLSFGGTTSVKPVEAAVTAWMRVHLMDDAALRSWFYGESCGLCEDEAWQIARRGMD